MSELWAHVCDGCGHTKDGCVCEKRRQERETETRAVLLMCQEVIDDELENRPARHSLGNLHARLKALTGTKEPEPGPTCCPRCGSKNFTGISEWFARSIDDLKNECNLDEYQCKDCGVAFWM